MGAMHMISRRSVLVSSATILSAASASAAAAPRDQFVSVHGGSFQMGGAPYRYAGANMWYGAYLGSSAPYGGRDRLRRELDALHSLGVDNLRVLGSGEISPLRNSLNPAFRD